MLIRFTLDGGDVVFVNPAKIRTLEAFSSASTLIDFGKRRGKLVVNGELERVAYEINNPD